MRKISIWGILALGLLLSACEKDKDQDLSDLDAEEFPTEEEGTVFDEEDLADLFEEEDSQGTADPSGYEDTEEPEEKADDYDVIGEEEDNRKTSPRLEESKAYPATDDGAFMVLTGSFSIKENAEAQVKKLRQQGYSAAKLVYFDAREFHSVVAGEYDNLATAQEVAEALQSNGIEAYVHKKRYGSGKR